MRLSGLLGLQVRTESGSLLGRVHDVRVDLGTTEPRITGLVVGEAAVLERLGIGAPHAQTRTRGRSVVAWHRVLRADRNGVIVRGETKSKSGD
jgi:sporulation protein YlmC with PRC-barrel domain